MQRFTSWCGVAFAVAAVSAASPCAAQRTSAGVHAVVATATATMPLTLGAARAGVAPASDPALSLQRASFARDSSETTKDRATRALVGGVIGATVGAVVGTIIDYELNKKTLNDRNAEPITIHIAGFLLPPVGAIVGAITGWHS